MSELAVSHTQQMNPSNKTKMHSSFYSCVVFIYILCITFVLVFSLYLLLPFYSLLSSWNSSCFFVVLAIFTFFSVFTLCVRCFRRKNSEWIFLNKFSGVLMTMKNEKIHSRIKTLNSTMIYCNPMNGVLAVRTICKTSRSHSLQLDADLILCLAFFHSSCAFIHIILGRFLYPVSILDVCWIYSNLWMMYWSRQLKEKKTNGNVKFYRLIGLEDFMLDKCASNKKPSSEISNRN